MQVKKEDIRKDILTAAENEFIKRGFKNASMRTIATKAHTTLGNLYNYFDSKETILDEIIGDTPKQILQLIETHEEAELPLAVTKEELEANFDYWAEVYMPSYFPLDLLLSKPLLILMEGCEDTKYEHYRETFLTLFQGHLATHLKVSKDSFLAKSLALSFLSALMFIGKNKTSMEVAKSDLFNYIKVMVLGMPLPKD